jgi:hypothetical protein
MLKFFRLLAIMVVATTITTGCAVNRATATVDPSVKLSGLKFVHVVQYADDKKNETGTLIADKLRSYGYVVTNSPEKRDDIDANVTYVDKWFWDITMYMLELTVTVREPKTDYPLANGNSLHTSLTRKSAKEMVDEVVGNIFK